MATSTSLARLCPSLPLLRLADIPWALGTSGYFSMHYAVVSYLLSSILTPATCFGRLAHAIQFSTLHATGVLEVAVFPTFRILRRPAIFGILKRFINRSSMLFPLSYAVHDALLSHFLPVPGALELRSTMFRLTDSPSDARNTAWSELRICTYLDVFSAAPVRTFQMFPF